MTTTWTIVALLFAAGFVEFWRLCRKAPVMPDDFDLNLDVAPAPAGAQTQKAA